MIWLVDCWKVHKSAEFLKNMAERFPLVKVLFVPANCTGKLQPADVVLQRPHRKKLVLPDISTDRTMYKSSYAALCRWHAES
jgi:hypothetical protein